jgi:uncharacterized lipoprotein YajG
MNYLKLNLQLKKNIIFKGLLMILLSAVVLSSCTKPEDIGQNVVALPGEQLNVHFTDTVTIQTHSYIVDSLPTTGTKSQIFGSVLDPYFGSSVASIYTQLRLANSDLDFGTNPVCDSIVLGLDYVGFYGDTNAVQHLKVFRLDDDMFYDSTYYSNDNVAYQNTPLFDGDKVFSLTDSVQLWGGKTKPHLRLTLDKSIGDEIVSLSGQTELSNNEEFLKYLKGFYITADKIPSGGGFAYIDLLSVYSRLTLYYHNDDEDSLYEYFLINQNCSYFNNFNHFDYQDADQDFKNQVVNKDTTLGMQELYLQPMSGVRTFMDFPFIDNLKEENQLAIHKAELIVQVSDKSDTLNYPAPTKISVVGIDSEGNNIFLTDYLEGTGFYGGAYKESNNQYVFNITHTIQQLLLESREIYGLRVIIAGETVIGNRLILNGNKSTSDNTRLRLYYTDVIP